MLPDVLAHNLKIVFCGTAVGKKSAEVSAYYAGPGNKFWRTLFQIGLTPRLMLPAEYDTLLQFGIGLTDMVKGKAGSDASLAKGDFGVQTLKGKILQYTPRVLCFNGKRAAQTFLGTADVQYGTIAAPFGKTKLFVAPSTSGAANGYWDEGLWAAVASLCR